MKMPKKAKRYCRYCNAHTEQKVDLVSTGHKRGTLRWGSLTRAKMRSLPGTGNKGRYSKKAVKGRKMKTKTTTRKVLIYTCQKCKKSAMSANSRRVSKIVFEGEK